MRHFFIVIFTPISLNAMQLKNYIILFLALFIFSAPDLHAQYNPWWQWAKADTVNTGTVSNGGSVLAVKYGKALWGHMTAAKRFAGGEPQGNYNLTEYDSNGKQLNVTLIVGKVQLFDAQADNAGNWYVLGRYYDTLLFSGGVQFLRNNPSSNIDADHFIVRFNAGSMIIAWVKPVGPFTTVSSRAFTMDNNNIYIAADSLDHTVVRTMSLSTGNVTSLFTQKGSSNTSSIQRDAQGNIYLAGSCAMLGLDFNGATEPATLPEPYSYIAKYRPNGTHIWHHWMRDRQCFGRKLTLHQDKFLYYSGSVLDSFTLGAFKIARPTGADFIAARLDTNGSVQWARQMDIRGGGTALLGDPYHAVVTPDTALVLFAQGSGYIYWRDSIETDLNTVTAATLVSIGADNKTRWARPIYTQYTTNQHVATEGNAVWVTGNIYSHTGAAVLDTLRLRVPAFKYTPYLAKTKLIRPTPVNPPAGIGGAQVDDVLVYPIPVRTTLRIDRLQGACSITLSDVSGRTVRSQTTTAGISQTLLDVADLPRGTYVLDMRGNDGIRVIRKIILQ